jgi:hypothetical protein
VPEVVAGIALPEGEPSSALATASGFRAAAGGFDATGGVTQRALGLVGSWQGIASVNFRNRCTGYEEAAASAQAACAAAAHAVRVFARDLEEARDRVRRLQREAEECVDRIQAAEARAAAARESEAAARARATSAALSAPLDGGSFSLAEETHALNEADAAAAEAGAAEADAADAREQLERLRETAEHEREQVEQAGRRAAGQVQAAAGRLPTVSYPAPPAPPAEGEEEDKPFWEDAWDGFTSAVSDGGEQVLGVGKGIGEGVVGIGEGGLMLYRLSPANALIDRDSFEREWAGVQDAAEFAWNNPGEFGKAVINWEDLAEGRYGEWVGNLGAGRRPGSRCCAGGARRGRWLGHEERVDVRLQPPLPRVQRRSARRGVPRGTCWRARGLRLNRQRGSGRLQGQLRPPVQGRRAPAVVEPTGHDRPGRASDPSLGRPADRVAFCGERRCLSLLP